MILKGESNQISDQKIFSRKNGEDVGKRLINQHLQIKISEGTIKRALLFQQLSKVI
jgi:hypothetical protein